MATAVMEAPRLIQWSRAEYYRLAEDGIFEGRRVELIKGQIYEMSPQKSPHSAVMTRVREVLDTIFKPGGYSLRVQCPLALGADSDPEPDLAVVAGASLDYVKSHPTTAALVVEVADTSLEMDRGRKASLYAGAGIADYWIVNLVDQQLEVYRDPVSDPQQIYDHGYTSVTIHTRGAVVSPLTAPNATIAVADLLP